MMPGDLSSILHDNRKLSIDWLRWVAGQFESAELKLYTLQAEAPQKQKSIIFSFEKKGEIEA